MNNAPLPTRPGWYQAADGTLWLLLPDGMRGGFYGMDSGQPIGIRPEYAGLEWLTSRGPFTRVTGNLTLSTAQEAPEGAVTGERAPNGPLDAPTDPDPADRRTAGGDA